MDTAAHTLRELKKTHNAIIMAHIYQRPEVQDAADIVGDSYELAVKASRADAAVIVFCGVSFMAETAAILNPDKTVLMPNPAAGCPMADMITPEALDKLKRQHPGVPVVCYVNSSAAVKALSDVCCTSSNAVRIVRALTGDRVIFVPDKYLGDYVRRETGRDIILYNGYCPTHVKIIPEQISALKETHPAAEVLVHGETTRPVQALADHVMSTGQMRDYVSASASDEFIVGTETGILHTLSRANPRKRFYEITPLAVCANMKKTTLAQVEKSLRTMTTPIHVPSDTAAGARRAIERMIEITEQSRPT